MSYSSNRDAFALVELDPVQEAGIDLLEILLDLVVEGLGVHQQPIDLVAEEIADDASGQAGFTLDQGRRPDRLALLDDLVPEAHQVVDLPLAALFGDVIGHGADDPAPLVLGHQTGDHFAKLGAELAAFDLAGDADFGGVGHVHEEAARERDLGGDS